jgi:hypothetical protein
MDLNESLVFAEISSTSADAVLGRARVISSYLQDDGLKDRVLQVLRVQ